MQFQCDTSLCELVSLYLPHLSLLRSLVSCKVSNLFNFYPLAPSCNLIQFNPLHFITFCKHFGSIYWFIQSLNILFVETYCEVSECSALKILSMHPFGHLNHAKYIRFISIYIPKHWQKKWKTFSLISFSIWWKYSATRSVLLCIHFGGALLSVHFSMDYGKIEFWTFVCTTNKNYDHSKHKRMWLNKRRKKTIARRREGKRKWETVPQVKIQQAKANIYKEAAKKETKERDG